MEFEKHVSLKLATTPEYHEEADELSNSPLILNDI